MDEKNKEYREGWSAFLANADMSRNPYCHSHDLPDLEAERNVRKLNRTLWDKGWLEARAACLLHGRCTAEQTSKS